MFSPSCPALHPSETHNLLSLWRWMLLHGDKEGRKAFAYSLLAMMALGGLVAVPLYKMLASLIRQLFGSDILETGVRSALPAFARDIVMYGAPSVVGIHIGGFIGMELPVLGRIQTDQSLSSQISGSMGDLIGIPWAMLEQFTDAVDALRRGDLYRAGEAVAPSVFRNIMSGYRLWAEGQTAATGRPINLPGEKGPRKIPGMEAVAKGAGFQPLSIAKAYVIYRTVEDLKNFEDAKQNEFATACMKTFNAKDKKGMKKIVREVNQWNTRMILEKRPEFRIDLKASLRTREKVQQPPRQMMGMAKDIVAAYR